MISERNKNFPRIFLLEPKWGNNTYPYYFGSIKEVMLKGINTVIVKEKISSVEDLKKNGLKKSDIIIFGYGWLGSELFEDITGIEDLNNLKNCFFFKSFNNYTSKI